MTQDAFPRALTERLGLLHEVVPKADRILPSFRLLRCIKFSECMSEMGSKTAPLLSAPMSASASCGHECATEPTIPTRHVLRETGKDTLHIYAHCRTRASRGYPYGGTAYANPDAPTQIANGLSTTTFTYDNNGNVTQKTVDGTTTT